MKSILHITNEISKKNFSISSMLIYILDEAKRYKFFKSSILCSKSEKKNLNIITQNINWLNFFKIKNFFLKNCLNFNIFHVHGIWAPIQLYMIILSIIHNKLLVIHLHGMILPEAMLASGKIKFLLKTIALYFLRIFFYQKKNVFFIAITNQEAFEIYKKFPTNTVKILNNPIPFLKYYKKKNIYFKKNFVFFGRIHPHKNVTYLIKSFIESNLAKKNWKLKIYGIADDNLYLKKIHKIIKNYEYIKILNPIFGKKKQKVMNESWANILVSKSEVLSFSILESGMMGLPSVINKSIETVKKDNYSVKVPIEGGNLANELIKVSNWSLIKRLKLYKNTSNFFFNYQKEKNSYFFRSLFSFYEKSKNNFLFIRNKNKSKIESFFITSISNSLSTFLPSIILFLCYFFLNPSLAADVGIVNSSLLLFTQFFSGNIRMIAVKSNNSDLLSQTLSLRILVSILFLIILSYILFKNDHYEHKLLIFLSAGIVLLSWMTEMILSIYELNKDIIKLLLFFIVQIAFQIIFIFTIFLESKFYFLFSISIYFFSFFLFCVSKFKFNYSLGIKKSFSVVYSFNFLNYYASIFTSLSVFSWRLYFYFIYPKEIAATFFAAFAISSFPGTLFNNVIGPTFFNNKIKINNIAKLIIKSLFIFFLINFIINLDFLDDGQFFQLSLNSLFLKILSASLVGTFIMTYAVYKRYDLLFLNKLKPKEIFLLDVNAGIYLASLAPALHMFGNYYFTTFAYLCGSIVMYLIYYFGLRIYGYKN